MVFDQFASREGELITGTVNRVEPRAIILDVGKASRRSSPRPSSRRSSTTGSARTSRRSCSRSAARPRARRSTSAAPTRASCAACSSSRCRRSTTGTVEIKAIAREAGSRSQGRRRLAARRASTRSARPSASAARASRRSSPSWAARRSTSSRGTRTPRVFVANALSARRRSSASTIDEEHRIANVTVPERMLSLAIGREGQNARLAAKLTGWRIDIRSDVVAAADGGPRTPRPGGGRVVPEAARRPPAIPAVAEEVREPVEARGAATPAGRRRADRRLPRPRTLRRRAATPRSGPEAPRALPARCVARRAGRRAAIAVGRQIEARAGPTGAGGAARTSAPTPDGAHADGRRLHARGALPRALGRPDPGRRCSATAAGSGPSTSTIDTTTKEEPVARSRSGTRGRRGPRKPQRRDGGVRRPVARSPSRASAARSSCPARSPSRSSPSCSGSTPRTSSAS